MSLIYIKNAYLVDPSQNIEGKKDIFLKNKLVEAILEPRQNSLLEEGAQIIEADNLIVCPGLIDMHVHLREPGEEYKETIASGTQAAVAGGFTGLVSMPNTKPAVDQADIVASIIRKAKNARLAKVWPAAAMTKGRKGEELSEYYDLKQAGAVAVTDDGSWVKDSKVFRRVLDYAEVTGLLALSHAEDHYLAKGGHIHEGRVSTTLGLIGIASQVESIAVQRDVALAQLTGRALHLCHISTKESVEIIRAAKKRGLKVSAETAPHYLHLTQTAVLGYNTNAKMNPPLRAEEDKIALREAIADGTIEVIATDHAPHSILEKEIEFCEAAFGIIGLETALPLMLALVKEGVITLKTMVEIMSVNPAKLLSLNVGTLKIGSPADLTIINPNLKFTLTEDDIFSLSKNSPFLNIALEGRAVITIVDGRVVYKI